MCCKNSHRDRLFRSSLGPVFALLLITGNTAQGETRERFEMKSPLMELSYRQIGSGNRVHIVVDPSTVTIIGQGGFKREKFTRKTSTPPALWKDLTLQAEKFLPGEIQSLLVPESDTRSARKARAFITIQTTGSTEKSKTFYDLDAPDKLKPLIRTIFWRNPLWKRLFITRMACQRT